MRKATIVFGWILVAGAALPGCVIAIGGSRHAGGSDADRHMEFAGPHGPRCADIEIARNIGFSGPRAEALASIAELPGLLEHEQLFLVDANCGSDGFSGDKADVLVALAANPALTQAGRERIALRLPHADLFAPDVVRVSQALLPE